MFDCQRLWRSSDIASAPFLAASIFLDVLNVFLILPDDLLRRGGALAAFPAERASFGMKRPFLPNELGSSLGCW